MKEYPSAVIRLFVSCETRRTRTRKGPPPDPAGAETQGGLGVREQRGDGVHGGHQLGGRGRAAVQNRLHLRRRRVLREEGLR
eukprot:1365527-Pyramimonas_sp.AAC.1